MKTYKIDPLGKNRPLMLVRGTRLPESFPDSVAEHMAKSLKANCRGVFTTINGEISSLTASPGVVVSREANEDNNTLVVMTEGMKNESVDWEDSTGKQFRLEHAGRFAGSQYSGQDLYYTGAYKDLRTFVTGVVPYTGQPLVAANAKQWYFYTTPEGVALTFRGCIQAPEKGGTDFVGLKIDSINFTGLDNYLNFDITLDCDSAVLLGSRNGMNDNSKPFNMITGIGWLQIVATDDFKSHIKDFNESIGNGDTSIHYSEAYDGFTYNVDIKALEGSVWVHAGNNAQFRIHVKEGSALDDSIIASPSGYACESLGYDMSGSGHTFPIVEEVAPMLNAEPTVINLTTDNSKQVVVIRLSDVQEGEQLHLDLSDTIMPSGYLTFCSVNALKLGTEHIGNGEKSFVIDIPRGNDVFAFFGVNYNSAGTLTLSRTKEAVVPEPTRTPGFYSADGQLVKAMTKEEVEQNYTYTNCPSNGNDAIKNATSFVWPDGATTIGNNAFYECSGLTSVTIPSTVTSIGNGAFSKCSGLTSVTIPSTVTSIGNSVFSYCTGLTSVTIPEGVTSIGNSAFSGCTGLTSVTIPSTVTSIGQWAFKKCTGLNPLTVPNTVTTIGNDAFKDVPKVIYGGQASGTPWGALQVVAPPPTPGFYSADNQLIKAMTKEEVEVGSAYDNCPSTTTPAVKNATKFVWPEGVTAIGNYVFYECSGLTSVTIPEGVTSIRSHAFSGCSGLTSVTIPEGVTTIRDDSFSGCSSLASVTIPSTVTSIGGYAFRNCRGLTSVTIPEGVTSISYNTFDGCSGLTSVTIPSTVTEIGSDAFSGCSALTSVTIPEGVTSIGSDAFNGCSGLTSITIPEGVTSIERFAFSGCSGLTSVTIPEGVTTIGDGAFNGCSGLTSVTIPSTVTSIGERAFDGCTSLNPLTVPNTVTTIGENAFYNVPKVIYGGTATGSPWGALKVEAPKPTPGFYNSSNQLIKAFTKEDVEKNYSLSNIPSSADPTLKTATKFVWPEGVTKVGTRTFRNCSALTEVTIPEGVTSIGERAFDGCSGLTSVTIPSTVTEIGSNSFVNCSGLTSVTIPEGVTTINDNAFAGCSALTELVVPNTVTTIGVDAFRDVPKVVYGGTASGSPWGALQVVAPPPTPGFYSADNQLIKAMTKEEVEQDDRYSGGNWPSINSAIKNATRFVWPDGVTKVGECFFKRCSGLTSVEIPSTVTSIGEEAFDECTGLTSVTIPSTVTRVGDFAFSGCTGLTSITIQEGVTSIGRSEFSKCTGLTSVTIPSTVTSIGVNAFNGCTSLNPLTVPNTVTTIEDYAFRNVPKVIYGGTATGTPWGALKVEAPLTPGFYSANDRLLKAMTKEEVEQDYTSDNCPSNVTSEVNNATKFVWPDGVTKIGKYVFNRLPELTSVTIPNTVTSIGYSAFMNCVGLTSVTIPEGVTFIDGSAFKYCNALTSVTIPSTITSMGKYVFENCGGLTEVVIQEGASAIGTGAFGSCSNLTSVTIPGSVKSVDSQAFRYCSKLATVVINEGVTAIGSDAFDFCAALTSVTIPNTVISIGECAFIGCTGLNPLTVPNTVATIGANAFKEVSKVIYSGSATGKPWGAIAVAAS